MIPLLQPSCTQAEIDAVTAVLQSGWWGNGKVVEQFEAELAARYNYSYCVTVNSATAALHLAMKVLNIGPGDEVIVPALTFVSTGLAPLYVGANVVLADVDPDTLCMNWDHAAKLVTKRTKAVIPVDYAGYPASRRDIGVPVVQDAAHSCGGSGYGDLVCLSFHPVKNLATGDGGAILTNDRQQYERLRALRWCGINRSTWERAKVTYGWDYDIQEVGYKCHWNDIQAAIGLVQLQRLEELNAVRKDIADFYTNLLAKYSFVQLPKTHRLHTWHLYAIRVPEPFRDYMVRFMLNEGISAGVHYKPLNSYPMFTGETPITTTEWKRLISLPIFYDLKDSATITRIAEVLTDCLDGRV